MCDVRSRRNMRLHYRAAPMPDVNAEGLIGVVSDIVTL